MTELPAPGSDDVLWLVDLSNYVFRAYHALPPLQNTRGEPTGATLGTMNMLNRVVEDYRPAYLAVAMDSKGRGFRGEMAPSYKANRPPAPSDLKIQLERCRDIFEGYRVPILSQAGYEADDIIATVVAWARAAGLRVVIASSDKDLMQLVEPGAVWLWDAMRNNVYGPAEVHKKFGVGPDKVRELLALVGDSSDNIPGVPGIGPKTAAALLAEFGSLAELCARVGEIKQPKRRQALAEHIADIELAYRLVELRTDAALELDREALRYGNPDVERLRELFTELQFPRFLELIEARPKPAPLEDALSAVEPVTVLDRAALEQVAARARDTGRLALMVFGPEANAMRMPLTGVGLCPAPGETFYLPLGHRYLTAPKQLARADVVELLGPVLADPAVAKWGHDLKLSAVVLAHHGLPLAGARFDSMVASYLLDPEATHKLGLLAERDARMRWTDFEKAAPPRKKGAPRHAIDELEIELLAPLACAHVEAVCRLGERYRPELETEGLLRLHDEVEMPLTEVLTAMELRGVLIDTALLAELDVEMARELGAIEERAYQAAGHPLNLASPKQLEAVLFDELGLKVQRKTKTGRSTDAEVLEALVGEHPLPGLVLEHRSVAKLKGTYVEALPKLIHPETGRIHTSWEQAVAATGRISSRDPNLQNIPVRNQHGKRIRQAFVAPPGHLILGADYSQIELRILAHLSGDPKLVEAFRTGQDVHVRTAMEVFGVSAGEVTPAMRAQCKTVNFGVIYGMGPLALSKQLGIARAEAKRFIDAYFERYHGVRDLLTQNLAKARASRSVRTLLGRRRLLPDLRSSHQAQRAYAERIANNTPIQGTAADLLKLAMVKLAEPVVPGAHMVLTVHDELVFEIPEDRIELAATRIKELMESILELSVPLVVDVGWGRTWADAH